MVIESIKLENFRNYETLELQLDPGTNIFYGENAQGKTNILELGLPLRDDQVTQREQRPGDDPF